MSTKIFDAYKYTGKLGKLMQYLYGLRGRHTEVALSSMAELCLGMSRQEIFEFVKKLTSDGPQPHESPTASAMVYIYKDELYVQFFGLADHLLPKSRSFEDFHYQNSTDPPPNISASEFDKRRRIWEAIMKHGTSFGENGLSFNLLPPHSYFYMEVVKRAHGWLEKTN